MILFLDTHVAAFLHAGDKSLFSPAAIHMLNAAEDIRVSPMVALELTYLWERGRLSFPGDQIAGYLASHYGIVVDIEGAGAAILAAADLNWTRDPFDRVITAQAAHYGAFLLTKDAAIKEHYAAAVW